MPYGSKAALPPAVKKLPSHGQSIYRKAFNAAYREYGEEKAHAIAWAAVKHKYTKKEGRWMAKTKDAFPPAEEEEGDVCDPESDAYDEEACEAKKAKAEDAFPPAEGEEEEIDPVCDPDSPEYDEDECERLKAEKTEARPAAKDSIHWTETAMLDAGKLRMTTDGYLVAQARVARTGIQLYQGHEIGDTREVVRVYRPETTVFDHASLQTFAHRPVTLGHPPVMVNAHNWKSYAVGHIDGEIMRDGDMVRVPMLLMDAKAIEAVRAGTSQLSVGYDARLEMTDGVTPGGEPYDAVQHDIRVNHIALTPLARGGPQLRIGDQHRKGNQMTERASMLRTLTLDGIEVKLSEPSASIVSKMVDRLTNENQTLSGTVVALQQQLRDAKVSDADLDKRVAARQHLVAMARKVLGDDWKPEGKSSAAIRRAAVIAKLGDEAAKEMTDAAIEGAFKAVTSEPVRDSGTRELAMALNRPGSGPSVKPSAEEAWEERGKQMREAWKTNNGSMVRQ